MKGVKYFLTGIFPFLVFDVFMGPVFPLSIPVTAALAWFYSSWRSAIEGSRKIGLPIRGGLFLYRIVIAILLFFFCRVLLVYHPVLMWVLIAVLLGLSFTGKVVPELSAGVLLNICAVLFFYHFIPPPITAAELDTLQEEKYAKPVHLFVNPSELEEGHVVSPFDGVRMIVANEEETDLYFTVDRGPQKEGSQTASLFRIGIDSENEKETAIYSGGRLFGIAFATGPTLLATDYYSGRLLLMNPETLEVREERETSKMPQFIIVDERGGRVTVLHEGLGIANIYSLPDIKYHEKRRVSGAPSKIVVDMDKRVFYAANWMYPYMLTETEIYSLKTTHKQFFLSFDSGGVALDNKRDIVYVTKGLTGKIFAVDRNTFEPIGEIDTEPFVRPVCFDAKRELIIAGNMTDPYVSVFKTDGELIGKIFVGPSCREIYVTPGGRVFAGTLLGIIELDLDSLIADVNGE